MQLLEFMFIDLPHYTGVCALVVLITLCLVAVIQAARK